MSSVSLVQTTLGLRLLESVFGFQLWEGHVVASWESHATKTCLYPYRLLTRKIEPGRCMTVTLELRHPTDLRLNLASESSGSMRASFLAVSTSPVHNAIQHCQNFLVLPICIQPGDISPPLQSPLLTCLPLPDPLLTCLPVCCLSPINILHSILCSTHLSDLSFIRPRVMSPVPLLSLAPAITCCSVVGNGSPGSCNTDCNICGCYRALDLVSLMLQYSVNDGVMVCLWYYVVRSLA
jgi:hypothetical protein